MRVNTVFKKAAFKTVFFKYSNNIQIDRLSTCGSLIIHVELLESQKSSFSIFPGLKRLSRLEAEIFSLDKKLSYSNLTKEERQAIYSLKDDTSIIIKEADKGSGIVACDKEDYLAEAITQLKDKDVYQELKGNIAGPLEKIIKSVLRKVRNGHKT